MYQEQLAYFDQQDTLQRLTVGVLVMGVAPFRGPCFGQDQADGTRCDVDGYDVDGWMLMAGGDDVMARGDGTRRDLQGHCTLL